MAQANGGAVAAAVKEHGASLTPKGISEAAWVSMSPEARARESR